MRKIARLLQRVPNFMLTGLWLTIVRRTTCLPVMVFSSIMKVPEEVNIVAIFRGQPPTQMLLLIYLFLVAFCAHHIRVTTLCIVHGATGETFVTRKITRAVARIVTGHQEFVELGNMDSQRDWGHAKDYIEVLMT